MAEFDALGPGTDLPQLARQLRRVYHSVLGGARPPSRPRPLMARSWSRVLSFGLDRIAAPRADTALSVSGLGLCLPERLPEGGLIRPAGSERRIRATLDRTGPPVLEVCGDAEPGRAPLTRRHAEILTRLPAAGAAGRSAHQLSRELYGDDAHVVTVRAEISRLRRAIGALVTTDPYRLAVGVIFAAAAAG